MRVVEKVGQLEFTSLLIVQIDSSKLSEDFDSWCIDYTNRLLSLWKLNAATCCIIRIVAYQI